MQFGGTAPGVRYLHRDRLGSVVAITNEGGEETSGTGRLFDAFGKARNPDMSSSGGLLNGTTETTRGFTQHEHLNSVQLIHMNGRAYDYNLGRFLSVDPIVQFPENSQSLNSYSYLMNNPMAGTDPSGYMCESSEGVSGHCGGRSSFDPRSVDPLGTRTYSGITGRTGFAISNGRAELPTSGAGNKDAATLNSPSERFQMPGKLRNDDYQESAPYDLAESTDIATTTAGVAGSILDQLISDTPFLTPDPSSFAGAAGSIYQGKIPEPGFIRSGFSDRSSPGSLNVGRYLGYVAFAGNVWSVGVSVLDAKSLMESDGMTRAGIGLAADIGVLLVSSKAGWSGIAFGVAYSALGGHAGIEQKAGYVVQPFLERYVPPVFRPIDQED